MSFSLVIPEKSHSQGDGSPRKKIFSRQETFESLNDDIDLIQSATDSAYEVEDRFEGIDFLAKLPRELALHVLSYIDSAADMHSVYLVSRKWFELAQNNNVWGSVFKRAFPHEQLNTNAYFARRSGSSHDPVDQSKQLNALLKRKSKAASSCPPGEADLMTPRLPLPALRPSSLDISALAEFDKRRSGSPIANIFHTPTAATNSPALQPSSPDVTAEANAASLRHIASSSSLSLRTDSSCASIYDYGTPGVNVVDWKDLYRQRLILEHNWKNGILTASTLEGHEDSVYCIQFDGQRLVSGSRDCKIKIWNLRTKTCERTLAGHEGSVLCLQYDKDHLVSGSSDATAVIWDMKTGAKLKVLRGHRAPVLDIRFEGDYVVTCSKDCTIRVWRLADGAFLHELTGHNAAVNAVHLHGTSLVSASGDCIIKLWDIETGTCLRDYSGHTRGLACVQYDGEFIVSGSNDKTIIVWNASTGERLHVFEDHTDLVRTLCFNKQRVVSGSYDQHIRVWNLQTGELELQIRDAHASWVFHVQMDPTRIVSASQDRKITIWDFTTNVEDRETFMPVIV